MLRVISFRQRINRAADQQGRWNPRRRAKKADSLRPENPVAPQGVRHPLILWAIGIGFVGLVIAAGVFDR